MRAGARRQLTFVCFFDSEKVYGFVPHDLLLYLLLPKGVPGNAFRVIDRMYAAASSRGLVAGACSAAFPIRRGAAPVYSLSPLLYAIFIDSGMDSMYAAVPPGHRTAWKCGVVAALAGPAIRR